MSVRTKRKIFLNDANFPTRQTNSNFWVVVRRGGGTLRSPLTKVTNAKQIFICQVLHREQLPRRSYSLGVNKHNKYLKAVISDIPNARYWHYRGVLLPSQEVLAADGVHLNDHGQYLLYCSYRGAVIQSLKSLGLA